MGARHWLLFSPGEIQQPEPWAPERGEVAFDDDSLESLVFDSANQLVGTLLLTLPPTPDAGPDPDRRELCGWIRV